MPCLVALILDQSRPDFILSGLFLAVWSQVSYLTSLNQGVLLCEYLPSSTVMMFRDTIHRTMVSVWWLTCTWSSIHFIVTSSLCETLWESEKLMTISLLASWIRYIRLTPSSPAYLSSNLSSSLNWSHRITHPSQLTHPCALPRLPSPMFTCLSISHSSRSGSNSMLGRKHSLTSNQKSTLPPLNPCSAFAIHSSFFPSMIKM